MTDSPIAEVEAQEAESTVYFFVGKPFLHNGEQIFLHAYFAPATDNMADVIEYLGQLGETYKLTPLTGQAASTSAAPAADGSVIETKKAHTFIRRNQRNKNPKPGQGQTTPIIDIYPPYVRGANGVYGVYPLCSVWLNSDEQIAEFEKATGLVLADLPLYASQTPAMRDPDYVADWEIGLESPIDIQIKTSPKTKEDGTPGKQVRLHSWKA